MSLIVYIIIMQIDLISSLMMLTGTGFFACHGWQYTKLWWMTPSDQPVPGEFWKKRRKQAIAAGIILFIGFSLPSRGEAVAQYAAWKVSNASIWDRMFADKAALEDVVGR